MTVRIGYLHRYRHPEHQQKAYVYASVAAMEGASMIVFSPGQVNVRQLMISGHKYRKGKWVGVEEPLPDVVINASSPSALVLAPNYDRIAWLEERVPFTCQPVGDKQSVLRRLKSSKWFEAYIPDMLHATEPDQLKSMIDKYGKVVMKPFRGNNGNDVMQVERNGSEWSVLMHPAHQTFCVETFATWLKAQFSLTTWLIQPRIESVTPDGLAFDFRVLVQKGKNGRWQTTVIHPKLALPGMLVTNDIKGGSVPLLEPFLSSIYPDQPDTVTVIHRMLRTLGLQVAMFLDQSLQEEGLKPLSQIGLDIGMDRRKRLWIYEVNWYPGFAPTLNWDVTMPYHHIQYAISLAKKEITPLAGWGKSE